MFSVSFRYDDEDGKDYRPYADGLSSSQLYSYVGSLALLAQVRDIRIELKNLPYKLYTL